MDIFATLLLIPLLSTAPAMAPTSVDTLNLDLNQAIEQALGYSHSAQTLDLDLSRAQHEVKVAKGRFGTQADAQFVMPRLDEGVRSVQVPGDLPRYDSYGTREVSTNLSLNQPLPTNGRVGLTGYIYQTDDTYYDAPTEKTQKQRTFFSQFQLDVSQPLFTPNTLKLGLERAELNHDMARRAYMRGQLNLSYDVTLYFFRLVQAQGRVDIARDALHRQQENYELAQRKYNAGLIPEMESLQMEVDLANADNDLLARQADLIQAADQFRLVTGLDMWQPVRAQANLSPRIFDVDPDLAMSHALAHRTEINDLEDRIRQSEIFVTETDARGSLKGELSAFYNLTGISDPSLTDADVGDLISSSWDDLKRRPGNRGVTFSLSLPLWDSGVNEQEVAVAEIAVRRGQLDQTNLQRRIVQQVQAALASFEGAKRRLDILQKSLDIALRGYGISQKRFESGDITSQALADNRDRLVQARLSYLDAFVSYRTASADLRRQTLYDFENGKSLVTQSGS